MKYVCEVCNYPAHYATDACDNPACMANPSVPEEIKARRRAEQAKRKADEAERARLRALRSAVFRNAS
jgi:hypothetical protein